MANFGRTAALRALSDNSSSDVVVAITLCRSDIATFVLSQIVKLHGAVFELLLPAHKPIGACSRETKQPLESGL